MTIYYTVVNGIGETIADGIQDVRRARRIADEHAAQFAGDARSSSRWAQGVAVVYDNERACTEECANQECEHEVYRAEPIPALNRGTVQAFARDLARTDRAACAAAGTEMDGNWTGECTTALADHFGVGVREMLAEYGEDVIAWAEEAYAAEAQRDTDSRP